MFTYKIKLDIEEDAWNWWGACNHISHGMDWRKRVSPKLYKNITGKTLEEANKFLFPYLKKLYKSEQKDIQEAKSRIEKSFSKNFITACGRLERLTGKSLFRKNYKIYLTTFPRGPYWLKTGGIWFYIRWNKPNDAIQTFLHEVLHFQFIHYWRNKDTAVRKLSKEEFEFLKESLTVVLDKDFVDIAGSVDIGYSIHKKFRAELHKFWIKNKDFDRLVEFGVKNVGKFVKRSQNEKISKAT